jgi:hypothetical protein
MQSVASSSTNLEKKTHKKPAVPRFTELANNGGNYANRSTSDG